MLETFTSNTFSPYINDTFRILPNSPTPLDVVLSSVTEVGKDFGRGRPDRVPFSIIFHGPIRPILPQQIYPMEHPEIGAFEIFLVPLGPDKEGMQYEAVFN